MAEVLTDTVTHPVVFTDFDGDDYESPRQSNGRSSSSSNRTVRAIATVVAVTGLAALIIAVIALIYRKTRGKEVQAVLNAELQKQQAAVMAAQEKELNSLRPNPAVQPANNPNSVIITAPAEYTDIVAPRGGELIYPLEDVLSGRARSVPKSLGGGELAQALAASGGIMRSSGSETETSQQQRAIQDEIKKEHAPLDPVVQSIKDRALWDINSVKYCGETGWIYLPTNGASDRGRCLKQCELDEDFMIWRAPAGDVSRSYRWVCRKRCIGKQDQQGFCQRKLFNPEYLTGYKPLAAPPLPGKPTEERDPNLPPFGFPPIPGGFDPTKIAVTTDAAYCGTGRHYGRYCYNVGTSENRGDFRKMPMNCDRAQGFTATPSGLSCYKCPPGTGLVGSEQSRYLCAEECPEGSTHLDSGSTFACYLKARSLDNETYSRLAIYTEEEVLKRQQKSS